MKINEVQLSSEAKKDLDRLPDAIALRIFRKLGRLVPDMSGDIGVLTNREPRYRLRVGDYRALFDGEDGIATVWKVRHRRDVYDEGETVTIHAEIVKQNGVAKYAMIPMEEYERILAILEDQADLAAIEESKLVSTHTIPLAQAMAERFGRLK